jgi:signal transduction histidine kinase
VPATVVARVLRIVHEALSNVQRHAGVDAAMVRVIEGRAELLLVIEDAGPGFDPSDVPPPGGGHYGLWLMRERALALGGRLEVSRSPAGGARVAVSIPTDGLR